MKFIRKTKFGIPSALIALLVSVAILLQTATLKAGCNGPGAEAGVSVELATSKTFVCLSSGNSETVNFFADATVPDGTPYNVDWSWQGTDNPTGVISAKTYDMDDCGKLFEIKLIGSITFTTTGQTFECEATQKITVFRDIYDFIVSVNSPPSPDIDYVTNIPNPNGTTFGNIIFGGISPESKLKVSLGCLNDTVKYKVSGEIFYLKSKIKISKNNKLSNGTLVERTTLRKGETLKHEIHHEEAYIQFVDNISESVPIEIFDNKEDAIQSLESYVTSLVNGFNNLNNNEKNHLGTRWDSWPKSIVLPDGSEAPSGTY